MTSNMLARKHFSTTVIATSLAVVSAATVTVWIVRRRRSRRSGPRRDDDDDDLGDVNNQNDLFLSLSSNGGTDDAGSVLPHGLAKQFADAATRVWNGAVPETKMQDADRLALYALYKQVTVGEAPARFAAVSWNLIREHAKYTEWSKLRDMPRPVAAAIYVAAVNEIASRRDDGGAPPSSSGGFAPHVSRLADTMLDESETSDGSPGSELLTAAGRNDTATLRELLTDNGGGTTAGAAVVDADHADSTGQTALHIAADKGSLDSVTMLLEHGASATASDQDGISVLQAAVIAGHVDICRLLLEHGADPDQADSDGDTPRNCADDDGSTAMKELFQNGHAIKVIELN